MLDLLMEQTEVEKVKWEHGYSQGEYVSYGKFLSHEIKLSAKYIFDELKEINFSLNGEYITTGKPQHNNDVKEKLFELHRLLNHKKINYGERKERMINKLYKDLLSITVGGL